MSRQRKQLLRIPSGDYLVTRKLPGHGGWVAEYNDSFQTADEALCAALFRKAAHGGQYGYTCSRPD
jgi:hypothetical protein